MNIELNIHPLANAVYPRQSLAQTETTNFWLSQHQPAYEESLDVSRDDESTESRVSDTESETTSPELSVIRGFSNLFFPVSAPAPVAQPTRTPSNQLDVEA